MTETTVIRWLLTGFFVTWLNACTGTSPATSFYTLRAITADPPAVTGQRPPSGAIGIGPITLADPVSRSRIIIRNRHGNLEPAEFHRWSGSLVDNLSTVLADEIAHLLDHGEVFAYPWISGLQPVYQIRINIRQFDGEPGKQATLKADWLLIGKAGQRRGAVHRTVFHETVTGRAYSDLIRAHEKNVAKLAENIAGVLQQQTDPAVSDTITVPRRVD